MLKKLILFRLSSCLLVQSWFVPDETWQVTEIAHYFIYGYGYLCWEWKEAIRSFIYPGFFSAIYYLLSILNLDSTFMLINLPRIISSIIFALGDFYTVKFFAKLYGSGSSHCIVMFLCTSWFLMYCAPRTLTSCIEMTFLAIALYYYPWHHEKESISTYYLLWGGLGCVIRPTTAVFLLPFCLKHLAQCRKKINLLIRYFMNVFGILLLTIGLDSLFYFRFTVVPWNFLKFNLISGLSSHYGMHPWHWYFTQGLPVMCGIHLLPLIYGLKVNFKKYWKVFSPCLFGILIHSFLGHKEFRFLLPILPILLAIGADALHTFFKLSYNDDKSVGMNLLVLVILAIPNIFVLLYMGLVHQRGPIDVMSELRSSIHIKEKNSVLFLTPCHSTPLYSHLHVNIPIRFLTCEPNLKGIDDYEDEAEVFFKDPLQWIEKEFHTHIDDPASELPTRLIMFDTLYQKIEPFLKENNYKFYTKIFNSHFYDTNRGKYFYIFKKL